MTNEDATAEQSLNIAEIKARIRLQQCERANRRKKMLFRQIYRLLRLFVIVCLCYFLYRALFMHQWYLRSDVFNKVENNGQLTIEGNIITPDYKVLAALRRVDLPHKPIYLISTTEMEENLSELPPVKKAYIRRFWFPARLLIRLEELTPVLSISPKEDVSPIAFFTECGKLIGRDYLPLDKSYETFLVLSYGVRGDDYHKWNAEKVNSILRLANEIELLSKEKIKYIDLRNPKDVYIQLETAKVRIGEVDDSVYLRIQDIGSILPKIKTLKNKKIKYVDLRWKTNYLKIDNGKSQPINTQSEQKNNSSQNFVQSIKSLTNGSENSKPEPTPERG